MPKWNDNNCLVCELNCYVRVGKKSTSYLLHFAYNLVKNKIESCYLSVIIIKQFVIIEKIKSDIYS